MKSTSSIRNKLGLSQEEMAAYLSINRSQLAMYEKGLRDLPLAAFQKLTDIELFIHRSPAHKKTDHPHIKLQQAKAKLVLEKHARLQKYKQAMAQRKLDIVQKTYSQKLLLLDLVEHLKGIKKGVAIHAHHNKWLNIIEKGARKSIEQNGLHVQAKLQVQLKQNS